MKMEISRTHSHTHTTPRANYLSPKALHKVSGFFLRPLFINEKENRRFTCNTPKAEQINSKAFLSLTMNCLQNLSKSFSVSSTPPELGNLKPHRRICLFQVRMVNKTQLFRNLNIKTFSSATPSAEMSGSEVEEEKSDVYSTTMTEAMGAVLTYRHELGMNYNFILPDLIVGSCLQTPADVDKLRSVGVGTIFCLQQNSDLEYFSVDIIEIQEYAKKYNDIHHLRAEIRDFDAFDLRLRLPAVLSKLYKAVSANGGVTYIHCTAGLGRAPAVALAYMFWVLGYKLNEANSLLQSKRACFPKLDAIKSATADILTGLTRSVVTLKWEGRNCSSVEIAGLDIGWGQRVPLNFDKEKGSWTLERQLPEGRYEYKYIVDGEWTSNKNEPQTVKNKDGHINNYVQVFSKDPDSYSKELQERLASDIGDLTKEERVKIREFLEAYVEN